MASIKTPNVLVVDDDATIREFLSRLLALQEIRVKTADSGFKAVEMAKKEQFDIIFLDIRMPVMDGVSTYKELKKIAPHTKYVMMTGYSLDELLKTVEGENIEAFITKPFNINEIVSIIEEYNGEKYPEEIINILIVEPEEIVSSFFKKLFQNYNVTTVKTGRGALIMVTQRNFDLVISDMMLGDMNGTELYSKIQEIKPNSRIILVTGDAKKTEVLVKSCLYQQIKDILNK